MAAAYGGVGGGIGGGNAEVAAGELARGRVTVTLAGTGVGGVGIRTGGLTKRLVMEVFGVSVLREGASGAFDADDVGPPRAERIRVEMCSSRSPQTKRVRTALIGRS